MFFWLVSLAAYGSLANNIYNVFKHPTEDYRSVTYCVDKAKYHQLMSERYSKLAKK